MNVPYCELYDQGYTSLGGTTDTFRNPVLKETEGGGEGGRFRPAYELVDDGEERLGREWGKRRAKAGDDGKSET